MTEDSKVHVVEQIEAYLSDGLSPDERAAFEAHVAGCDECGNALAEAQEADAALRAMFRDARPAEAFEDRIIRNLRITRAPRRTLLHPMVRRTATAVAAAVLLTGAGVVVTASSEGDRSLGWFSAARHTVTSNLKQIGLAMRMEGLDDQSISRHDRAYLLSAETDRAIQRELVDVKQLDHVQLRQDLTPILHTVPIDRFSESSGSSATDNYSFHPDEALRWGENKDSGIAKAGKPVSLGDAAALGRGLQDIAPAAGPQDRMRQLSESLEENPKVEFSAIAKTQDLASAPYQVPASQAQPDPFAAQAPNPGTAPTNPIAASGRKVIRNGTMQFEVDRFDDAFARITKLVAEQGGFIATTDSDKLPNGKMKGIVTLRVPPEHLDTLVLTLRGIGDLKSQKISAEDVTKHYTDLESELRAARAMEERLLEIIKTGKGQIKDLLEAEKQLGVWREKIEQIEGEKRYLDNLIGLSTLTIEMFERDIRTPATASEAEQITMSLETEKVDDAYDKASGAIEAAKGRIIQSELKQFDAGQFGATIQAAVPPDAAEQVIARLRQLNGRIAHFARDSRRTTPSGEAPQSGITTVHREDVVISMQIYNLANVAPRRTTTLQLAAANVDHAYQQVADQVRSVGGRIVTSSLTKPDASQQAADLDVQIPADKADAFQDTLHGMGEVMRQESTENPDTTNVTDAKRGFHVHVLSLAAVPPRETQDVKLAAANVSAAFNDILNAVNAAGGRVLQSGLSEQDPHDVAATISFEVSRSAAGEVNAAIGKAAQVLSRVVNRSSDTENTLDSKIRLSLSLSSAEKMPPRQTVAVREEVSDVQQAMDDLANAATAAGGRRVGNGQIDQDRTGRVTANVIVEVPLDKAQAVLDQIDRMGNRRGRQVSYDDSVPPGSLARARIDATFSNSGASLGGEESTWDAIRHGLATSGLGLRWSLQMLVIGLCFVAPWVLVVWIVWRLLRRRPRPAMAPAA